MDYGLVNYYGCIWNVPQGLCAKGLVLSVAILKRGGAFKRRGSVGGLGSGNCVFPGGRKRLTSFSFVPVSATR